MNFLIVVAVIGAMAGVLLLAGRRTASAQEGQTRLPLAVTLVVSVIALAVGAVLIARVI